jgi:hypothetical protein
MMKLRICSLVFTALWVCTAASAADEPKPALKPGWKEADFKAFVAACADAVVKPAIQGYQDRVTASGLTDAKPFPEQEFRESVLPMCECITHRLAEKWTISELANNGLDKSKPFVEEALGGGQCKPGGMLGEMLEHARESKSETIKKD